mmetsp:Transcript_24912/g.41838  ORF Transcript_24912/g.41838 Transcript_24912/m.41838 type:complete len:155 (-) Transcript_24912:114-578(-)
MPGELSTEPILKDLLTSGSGKRCYVPLVEGDNMLMVMVSTWEELLSLPKNKFGIREPPLVDAQGGRVNYVDAVSQGSMDLVVTPGLAFDWTGGRLGRGKGYYDRFFSEIDRMMLSTGKSRPYRMGVALSLQMVDRLPMEPFDQKVDEVVFPSPP